MDADEQCEFSYQPEGWGKAYRFIALRYQKKDPLWSEREQYQLFDGPQYIYRVFVNFRVSVIRYSLLFAEMCEGGTQRGTRELDPSTELRVHLKNQRRHHP